MGKPQDQGLGNQNVGMKGSNKMEWINPEKILKTFLERSVYIDDNEASGYIALPLGPNPSDDVMVYWDNSDGGEMMIKAWSLMEDDPHVIEYNLLDSSITEFIEKISTDPTKPKYDEEGFLEINNFHWLFGLVASQGKVTDDRFDGNPDVPQLPMHPEIVFQDEGWVNYKDFYNISEANQFMNQLEIKNKYRKDFK